MDISTLLGNTANIAAILLAASTIGASMITLCLFLRRKQASRKQGRASTVVTIRSFLIGLALLGLLGTALSVWHLGRDSTTGAVTNGSRNLTSSVPIPAQTPVLQANSNCQSNIYSSGQNNTNVVGPHGCIYDNGTDSKNMSVPNNVGPAFYLQVLQNWWKERNATTLGEGQNSGS